jgi:lipopolysaccharide export system permease protein
MTILGRYIFRQAFGALVLILASLTGVIWIAVALRQLEFMASQNSGGGVFLQMTTLALPGLIAFIAPIALLIAAVHTLNRLNGDSELIIATAGGASTWRLLWPLMSIGVGVAITVAVINNFVAPWSNRTLRDLSLQVRTDLISQVLQPGKFSAPEPKLTIHIRDKAPDGTLLGLLIHDARDDQHVSSYLAESGFIVKQGPAAYLLMRNGHIVRKTLTSQEPADIIVFERYAVDINRFEQKADEVFVLRPRERTTPELFAPDANDPYWTQQPGRFISERHERLASAMYPLAFVLLALGCVGQAQTTRQNRTRGVVMAVGGGFAYRIAGIAAANFTVTRPHLWPWLYVVPLVCALASVAAISLNMRPRPRPVALQRLETRLRHAFARTRRPARPARGAALRTP